MHNNLFIYINLDWEKHIEDQDHLKKIAYLTEFAYAHKLKIYYSYFQLIEFTQQIDDLDENFTVSFGNQLDLILNSFGAIALKDKNHVFEVCFSDENTSLNYLNNKLLSCIKNEGLQAIIYFSSNFKSFLKITDNSKFEKIEFSKLCSIEEIKLWIIKNSAKRNFNLSNKHGENGKNNWSGESVLMCNASRASNLLNDAIAHFYARDNRLFNWDPEFSTYIEFFFEGINPQNQWHGFHLKKEDWTRVPAFIKEHFGFI